MLSQHLTGTLMRESCHASEEDIARIRALPNPPLVKLNADEIHVRRCRLASDGVDSRYGRFRTEDLPKLLELAQGAPVMVGHDRRTLGVARFFGGAVEKRGDVAYVVPRFYWPKAHSRAEDLRVMIDTGVYNEASIAFLYQKPTCSICGEDLRSCAHWPGRTYDGTLCFFYYDGVERVTEGSLVYRGAAPGTGFELACEHGGEASEKPSVDGAAASELGDDQALALTIALKHRGTRYLAALTPLNTARTRGGNGRSSTPDRRE
jgi:hypothetical protein